MGYGGSIMRERIVAVGLLTQQDLNLLGPAFGRAWPVEDVPAFEELLRAIDEADRKFGAADGPTVMNEQG
jgi:hypothetical protein